MSWYSDFPAQRIRQIAADVLAGLAIIVAITAGVVVHGAIAAFAEVGARLQEAGSGFEGTMIDVGEALGGVPFIGESIRAPFDSASAAGETLVAAGQSQQEVALGLAAVAGVLVALGPILLVVAVWLLPRLLFLRRAREARALLATPDGARLLALRALVTRSAGELSTAGQAVIEGWRSDDPAVVGTLAGVELRNAGVRMSRVG